VERDTLDHERRTLTTRTLGRSGLEVSALGYGCMGLNFGLGEGLPRAEAVAMIRAVHSARDS